MDPTAYELIASGREALEHGDAPSARAAFEAARELSESGPVFEGLAQTAYLELDFDSAIESYERSYAAYRVEGSDMGAIRCARTLAYLYASVRGDGAVMQGWTARAETLVNASEDSAEHGWVSLTIGMFESDREAKDRRFRVALDRARRFGDADLEFEALAYLGASLVQGDRIEEGMQLLDEALAAVVGGDVKNFQCVENIFCQLLTACEYAHDIVRAEQWMRVSDEIATRRSLPTIAAWCRTHYGGLLTAAGRWTEADSELTEATHLWTRRSQALRWTALIRLADLRVRQGRLEEAEQLLTGLDVYWEATRPIAALHFARGNLELATDAIHRGLEAMGSDGAPAGPVLSLLVDVELARGRIPEAAEAADRLEALASRHSGFYLRAAAALARGRVSLESATGDPGARLRDALAGFAHAQMPAELARARLELARALATDRPQVAVAEATAALEGFERLGATGQAGEAAALLRALGAPARTGPKGEDTLTRREAEILDLLGHGLSNPEISDRLYISRKTVEHHVSRILAKLGLRSRAEAAAYAARAGRSARK